MPFGRIVGGAAHIAAAVNFEYVAEPVASMITQYGNKYLQSNFPNLTYVSACRFVNAGPEVLRLGASIVAVTPGIDLVASHQRLAWAKMSRRRDASMSVYIEVSMLKMVGGLIPHVASADVSSRCSLSELYCLNDASSAKESSQRAPALVANRTLSENSCWDKFLTAGEQKQEAAISDLSVFDSAIPEPQPQPQSGPQQQQQLQQQQQQQQEQEQQETHSALEHPVLEEADDMMDLLDDLLIEE